ncbi:FAD-dependent monooxygenase [Streptacidiphilus sp. PAMC 29251]
MTDVRTALVIGGGIAGPVAAMALQRAGISARVYEAYEGNSAEGTGGMISLAPNGVNALAPIGLDDTVRAMGMPTSSIVLHSWNGKRLAEFGSLPGMPPSAGVWRDEMFRMLADTAVSRGIGVEHGKRLVTAEDSGDGVTAHFSDGSWATADILIGADGIRSTVRPLIDPGAPKPHYTGLLGFGGRPTSPTRTGLDPTGGTLHMFFGKRAFFAYQVFDDGRIGWFANLPRTEPLNTSQARAVDPQEWLRVLREAFAEDRTPAARILAEAVPADLIVVGAQEDLPNVPTWSRGRMVLIGDAAHATSPSSGQGASLAIESAVQLARCLRDLPAAQAFSTYEALRRPRVERIIAMAARTNSNKAAGPVARVVRDLVMPVAMKLVKPEKSAWQFEYRIDWDTPVRDAGHPTFAGS